MRRDPCESLKVGCGSNARQKSGLGTDVACVVLFGTSIGTQPARRAAPLRVGWNVSKQKGPAPTGCALHVTSQLISCPPLFCCSRRRVSVSTPSPAVFQARAPGRPAPPPSQSPGCHTRTSARPPQRAWAPLGTPGLAGVSPGSKRPPPRAQMAHSTAAVPVGALEQGCPIRVEHDRRRRQFTVRLNGNAVTGPPPPFVFKRPEPAEAAP